MNTPTVIVGSPRSGTTLLLECLTPDLSPEERYLCNEPDGLGEMIVAGRTDDAVQWILDNIEKLPAPVIKSPHATWIACKLRSRMNVVYTWRDYWSTAASMVRHEPSRQIELADHPYWFRYSKPELWPEDLLSRGLIAAVAHARKANMFADQTYHYGNWDWWSREGKVSFSEAPSHLAEEWLDANVKHHHKMLMIDHVLERNFFTRPDTP